VTHSFTIRKLALAAALAGSVCATVHAQVLGSEQIFAELIDRNQTRAGGLLEYTAGRVYRVSAPGGKIHAQIEGRMQFEAPESKSFVTRSEAGSANRPAPRIEASDRERNRRRPGQGSPR
jgi:hypothetical protein